LAVVAVGRRERERPVALDVVGQLPLAVRDVPEHPLAPPAEHFVGSAVGVERAHVVAGGPVLDQPAAGAGLQLHVPPPAALQAVELVVGQVRRFLVLDAPDVDEHHGVEVTLTQDRVAARPGVQPPAVEGQE
jgi:hypothetical protein